MRSLFSTVCVLFMSVFLLGAGKKDEKKKIKKDSPEAIVLHVRLSSQGYDIAFDHNNFQIPFGLPVKIVYTNAAKADSEIYHNVVVAHLGKEKEALTLLKTFEWDIQEDLHFKAINKHKDIIIGHTKTLAPGEAGEVVFSPKKRGDYHFFCFMPGHAALGMKGIFTIK